MLTEAIGGGILFKKDKDTFMKKIFFALLVISIIFPIFSCTNPTMTTVNPFVGTWQDENRTVWWTFTETEVSHSTSNPGEDPVIVGTYTFNDTHITITTTFRHPVYQNLDAHPEPFVVEYLFEGDTVRIGVFGVPPKRRVQ